MSAFTEVTVILLREGKGRTNVSKNISVICLKAKNSMFCSFFWTQVVLKIWLKIPYFQVMCIQWSSVYAIHVLSCIRSSYLILWRVGQRSGQISVRSQKKHWVYDWSAYYGQSLPLFMSLTCRSTATTTQTTTVSVS